MRAEKQLLLDEIKEKMSKSKAFVVTRYGRMNPNVASGFRINLAKTGGHFEVVRKTILMKAAAEAGVTLDAQFLMGHIGVVFADQDPIQTTKAVFQFRKEHEELIEVTAGMFDGKLYSAKEVEQLSKLPSKPEMQAQFLGLLEAVPSQTLGVIEALLTSIPYCLENKSNKS